MLRVAPENLQVDPREGALAKTVGLPDIVARVLLARGHDDPDRVRSFLRPNLRGLHDPFCFRDMPKAVDRIREAIRSGQSILIHGDYDVDGITGTVLLHKFFSLLHATSKPYIPARADGYSISPASVEAILAGGHHLVISVDNGTNAVESIATLRRHGVDVIVTDHHGTNENVADAFAVLNPRLPDSGYPDRDLAGCGVAFRLAAAIAESFSGSQLQSPEFAEFLADAVACTALGTVADVAPLVGENRTLVFHGLRALVQSKNPGIRALLDAAGVAHRGIDVGDIAFRIAPLINAAGRMGHAIEAVQLLLAPGYAEAQAAAAALERHNDERRRIERAMQDEVMAAAASIEAPAIALGADHWHPGVLGIVAARAAETFKKPVILVAFDGETGRGSGRCASGIHLRDALSRCSDLLESHGGHAAAVGLEVRRDNFDEFCGRFADVCGGMPVKDALFFDGPARFEELDPHTVRRLDMLGPFGTGHPRPRFLTNNVQTVGHPTTDARGLDLRLRVVADGQILPARLVRGAARFEELRGNKGPWDLLYSPRLATRGEEGPVLLEIHEMSAADGANPTTTSTTRSGS
ncbi:MAG: single-stranded-DNA-specific exonuclease RecJ [Planctomycetes bacterium]|nr:single-stranded-DNA-specific exonuclease RecJ [Planctomycetota bacterium]